MKLKKIKKITASVIGISTIGWSISSVIQPNDEEQIKALSAKTDSQDKVDINDLFNEFNIPITVQASPDKNNLIECIKLANPKLNNLIWEDLDVYYNDNGTFTISAIDSSTNYKGSAIKCISTTIVATPSDCKLENVGDTILISAKLSGLWKKAYKWNYKIPDDLASHLNIVTDYNTQTIAFILKSPYYGQIDNFDVSCTILDIAQSNTLTIKISSKSIFFIGGDNVLVKDGDVVTASYSADSAIDQSYWKYESTNSNFMNFLNITKQSNNIVFALTKTWVYGNTSVKVWYESPTVKTNILEFSIIPDESVVTSCHLELALNGSNGTYKTDGASSIDSVNVQTYFNKIFLDFEIIGTNFYDMQGKTIIELFNSKRIRNLTLFTTDDTTNDQFHVHHSWTYAGSGYPSEDIHHKWAKENSYIVDNIIYNLEWVLGISGSAGQGGTTVYITPCLDLSKIEVKWNNAQNLIEYTIRENAFHCKNIMWNADYGWYETPKFS